MTKKSESTKVLGTNATKRVTKSDLSHVFGKDSKSWYLWCGNFPNQFTRAYRYQLDTVPCSSHKKVAVPGGLTTWRNIQPFLSCISSKPVVFPTEIHHFHAIWRVTHFETHP